MKCRDFKAHFLNETQSGTLWAFILCESAKFFRVSKKKYLRLSLSQSNEAESLDRWKGPNPRDFTSEFSPMRMIVIHFTNRECLTIW